MKIKDYLGLPGWRVEIPGASRNDLPELFSDLGFKVGVEIGTWEGEFGKVLCAGGQKVYGVDPYVFYEDYVLKGGQEKFDIAMNTAIENLSSYDYTMIRKTSMDAVKDFQDGSIDWVYIDGNHAFLYATQDLHYWSKKVKKGGVISGHDYVVSGSHPGYCDCQFVVDAWTKYQRLKKWYILGKRFEPNRDQFRSWFWLNP